MDDAANDCTSMGQRLTTALIQVRRVILIGPIGIVLSSRHKHRTHTGTSTKHTHSFKHRHIHALHKALPNTTGTMGTKLRGCLCECLIGGVCMKHMRRCTA